MLLKIRLKHINQQEMLIAQIFHIQANLISIKTLQCCKIHLCNSMEIPPTHHATNLSNNLLPRHRAYKVRDLCQSNLLNRIWVNLNCSIQQYYQQLVVEVQQGALLVFSTTLTKILKMNRKNMNSINSSKSIKALPS